MNIHCRILDNVCKSFTKETCLQKWLDCQYQTIIPGKPDAIQNEYFREKVATKYTRPTIIRAKVIPIEKDLKLPNKTNYCKCTLCGEYFNSPAGFDKHRVGGWNDRRCLSEIEMREINMDKNKKGYWLSEIASETFW